MPMFTLLHFIEQIGGVERLFVVIDDLGKPAVRQRDIAESYHLDEGYLSKMITEHFEWKLLPKPATQVFIDHQLQMAETHNGDSGRIRARILDFASRGQTHQEMPGQ
jgi:hypothetical protein